MILYIVIVFNHTKNPRLIRRFFVPHNSPRLLLIRSALNCRSLLFMIIFCNMLTYTVKLAPQAEGGYTVTVPALPGCISEGDTLDETLRNIQEAIEGCLLSLVKRGKQIPIEFSAYRDVHVSLKKPRAQKRFRSYAKVAAH